MPTTTLSDGRVFYFEQDCRFPGCLPVDASAYRQIAGPGMPATSPTPTSSGPTLGLRKRPTGLPTAPSNRTPCEVYDAARAAGQSPAIVSALAVKCEAWKTANPGGMMVAADAPEEGGGVSPLLIVGGVLGIGAIIFFATR